MEQLELTTIELEKIGFKRTLCKNDPMNPARNIFKIDTLNGYFYYNPNYKGGGWYHKTIIGDASNDVCLDISQKPVLFSILQAFNVKFKIIM